MKYKNTPLVKEQMKFTATKTYNTNSPKGYEWDDQRQKSNLKSDIGFLNQSQDKRKLIRDIEQEYQTQSIGIDIDYEHTTRSVVNNNPQRDPENNFASDSYAPINYEYDRTINKQDCQAGYKLMELDSLEEEWTNQHATQFYDEVSRKDQRTGKTVNGFLERANYLDRI